MPSYQQLTRRQVRQKIGALAYARQHFLVDALSVPSTDQLTFTFIKGRQFPSDTFIGKNLYIADAVGQVRNIVDHDQVAGTVTIGTGGLGGTVPAGTTVEVWPADVDPHVVNTNINSAIGRGSDIVNTYVEAVPEIDDTYLIVDIPASFTRVSGFHYAYQGVLYPFDKADWLDPNYNQWLVRGRKLYLSNRVHSGATDLTIQGYRLPALPAADGDLIEMHPEFVMNMAAAMLEAGDAAQPGYDPEGSAARSVVWFREALTIREGMATNWQSTTVELPL